MPNRYFSQYVSPNIVIVPTVSFSEPSLRQKIMVGQVNNKSQETPGSAKNEMCTNHHQNLSSTVPNNNVPVQENHRSILINNSSAPEIQEQFSASLCNNVCVKTEENKCNVNVVTKKDVIKTVSDVESEKMVQKTLSWATNYLKSIGQIHPKLSKQQLSQTAVQQLHKQVPRDNEKLKQNEVFPFSSNSSLNISFADNAQYSTNVKQASTLHSKLPILKYETQDNSNSIKVNLLTHKKRVSNQRRTKSDTSKKYMNTIVQNTNKISLNSKKDSIKKACENERPDDAPSASSISLQSRKPKNSSLIEKARKYTRTTHHISSSSTSNKKNTLKVSDLKNQRTSKETQSKARMLNKQLVTPKKNNSGSKPKHDAQRPNSYSVKRQSTLSPKKQQSISGSYNIKHHKPNRDLLANKLILKKAKVYEKHGDTVKKEDNIINLSKISNKSFRKINEKELTSPTKCSAPIKSVVHTCPTSFDYNNHPVSQFQDTQHKEDLRNKLKRKHQSSINTKRENLIITVQNEENITANQSVKKNFNAQKVKQDTTKYKKIKLVINLSCEQCSDSSESDNDSKNNEYSVPNVDLSFLDDFNVDDIVDCLKTPEENGKSHVLEPFITSDKELPQDNNNNEDEIKIDTKNSNLNKSTIPVFLKEGKNKKLLVNDLFENKTETVNNNLKSIDPILKTEAVSAKGDNVKNLARTQVVENKMVFDLVDIMKSSLKQEINIMSTNDEDLTKEDMPLIIIETPESDCKIESSKQILKATAMMETAVNKSLDYQNTATLDTSKFPNSSISKVATIKTGTDMQPTKFRSIISNETIVISDSEDEHTLTTTEVNCNSTKSNMNSNKELEDNNIIDSINLSHSSEKDDLNHEPGFTFDATQVLNTKHNKNFATVNKISDGIYPQHIHPKKHLQSTHLCDSLEQKEITSNKEVTMTQGHDDKKDEINSSRISEKGESKSIVEIKNCINTTIENKETKSYSENNTSNYASSENVEPEPNAENDTSKNNMKDEKDKDIVIPTIKNNNSNPSVSVAKNTALNHDDTGKANYVVEGTKNLANENHNSSSQALIKKPTNNVFTGNKALAMILQNRLLDYFGVNYNITNLLRHGKYSKIFQCKDSDGNLYALKMMNKTSKPIIPYYAKEYMLKSLQKDIPKENFHCIFFIDGLSIKGHWCFLMEYYPSNLQVALKENGKCFHLDVIQKLSRQLVSAIVLLRNNNIAHLGIKPEHILLNSTNDKLKLAGFDEAQYIDQITMLPNYGTPSYRPPEVLLGYPSFHKIDVWAVACIMYEMATCRKLFPGCYNNDILYKQQCILGNIPYDMLYQSFYKTFHYSGQFFVRKHGKNGKNISTIHKFTRTAFIGSKIFAAYNINWKNTRTKKEKLQDSKKLGQFRELLEEMLALHPNARLPIEFVYTSQFLYESFDSNLWR